MSDLLWFVAHTRPRCEKKLAEYCEREGLSATLPCYHAAHKYRGKTVVFRKPLFPGYVFLRIENGDRQKVWSSDFVANLLEVFDQATLARQLEEILLALETNLEIRLAPTIGEGMRVKILRGPLRSIHFDGVLNLLIEPPFGVLGEQTLHSLHRLRAIQQQGLRQRTRGGQQVALFHDLRHQPHLQRLLCLQYPAREQ